MKKHKNIFTILFLFLFFLTQFVNSNEYLSRNIWRLSIQHLEVSINKLHKDNNLNEYSDSLSKSFTDFSIKHGPVADHADHKKSGDTNELHEHQIAGYVTAITKKIKKNGEHISVIMTNMKAKLKEIKNAFEKMETDEKNRQKTTNHNHENDHNSQHDHHNHSAKDTSAVSGENYVFSTSFEHIIIPIHNAFYLFKKISLSKMCEDSMKKYKLVLRATNKIFKEYKQKQPIDLKIFSKIFQTIDDVAEDLENVGNFFIQMMDGILLDNKLGITAMKKK